MSNVVAKGTFLGFDFGTRRIGIASGNAITMTATPLATLEACRTDETFAAIGRLVHEWQPEALVVGVPRHPDGASHEMTEKAQRFARRLEGRFGLPVRRVDERYTSVEAQGFRDADAGERGLDARSAAIILEQYLFERAGRAEKDRA